MNPPPQPNQYPQVVVVQQKSGCGKAAVILAIIAGAICLLIGGCFIVGLMGVGKVADEMSKQHAIEAKKDKGRKDAVASLEIVDFDWAKDGFGSVMMASFKIHNPGPMDLKDIEIECTHYAPSGTKIDSNKRTIYEIVKAGEIREFKNFNMGFIHTQAAKSVATVVDAAEVIPPAPAGPAGKAP